MARKKSHSPKLLTLLNSVCEEYKISLEAIRGNNRQRLLVMARREFCQRADALKEWSASEIGRAINRDHTTVMYHTGRTHKIYKPHLRSEARLAYEVRHGL
jgi:chromosomal replication initiation ATPase DnaA